MPTPPCNFPKLCSPRKVWENIAHGKLEITFNLERPCITWCQSKKNLNNFLTPWRVFLKEDALLGESKEYFSHQLVNPPRSSSIDPSKKSPVIKPEIQNPAFVYIFFRNVSMCLHTSGLFGMFIALLDHPVVAIFFIVFDFVNFWYVGIVNWETVKIGWGISFQFRKKKKREKFPFSFGMSNFFVLRHDRNESERMMGKSIFTRFFTRYNIF